MRSKLASFAAGTALLCGLGVTAAEAMPADLSAGTTAPAGITLVSGGCGPGGHRGFYGGCRPNFYRGGYGYGYHRYGYRRGYFRNF